MTCHIRMTNGLFFFSLSMLECLYISGKRENVDKLVVLHEKLVIASNFMVHPLGNTDD